MNQDRKAQPFDVVAKPKHYNQHPSGVEAVDICELLPFNLGNALKYVWRAGQKDDRKQDLAKGIWYLKRLYSQKTYRPSLEFYQETTELAAKVVGSEKPNSLLRSFLEEMAFSQEFDWPLRVIKRIEQEIANLEAASS